MRIAFPLALVTLVGALFPAAASAAAPVAAAGGSDLLPALVIAGAGALVIVLIMVVVPSARRDAGPSTPPDASPALTTFRAYPVNLPAMDSEPLQPVSTEPEAAVAAEEPEIMEPPVAAAEEAPEVIEPPVAEDEPAAEPAITREPLTSAAPTVSLAPPPIPVFAHASDDVLAAEQERSAVAVADPPRMAFPSPPLATPSSSGQPAPDLLAAISPISAPGDPFGPEPARVAANEPASAAAADSGTRPLLGDHSLAVPIAACIVLGLTVHLVRSRRRR